MTAQAYPLQWPDHIPRSAGIDLAYKAKAKVMHPDAGGSAEAMAELNAAREEALRT